MSYTPTTWTTGDTITASAMNKIENGIAGAGNNVVVQFSVTGFGTVTNLYGYIVYGIYDAQNSRWVLEQDNSNYWTGIYGFANDAPTFLPPYLTVIPNDNIGLFFILDADASITTAGNITSESALYYNYGSLVPDAYRITGDGSISLAG